MDANVSCSQTDNQVIKNVVFLLKCFEIFTEFPLLVPTFDPAVHLGLFVGNVCCISRVAG